MILAIIERGAGTDRARPRTRWAVPWASAVAPRSGRGQGPVASVDKKKGWMHGALQEFQGPGMASRSHWSSRCRHGCSVSSSRSSAGRSSPSSSAWRSVWCSAVAPRGGAGPAQVSSTRRRRSCSTWAILLGFGLNLGEIAKVGASSCPSSSDHHHVAGHLVCAVPRAASPRRSRRSWVWAPRSAAAPQLPPLRRSSMRTTRRSPRPSASSSSSTSSLH